MGHVGVGWEGYVGVGGTYRGGVGYVGIGVSGSCRGGVGHVRTGG